MRRSRAKRTAAIVTASAVVHLLLLSMLAIEATRSRSAEPPDQSAIQVTLERPPPPEPKTVVKKRPIVTRANAPAAASIPSPEPAVHAAPPTAIAPEVDSDEKAAMGDLVRALRGSVGCDNPDAVGLTKDEREACRRRFHAGLEAAKPLSGVPAAKRERFDRTVRCQNEYYGAPMPNGHAASNGAGGMPGLGYIPRMRDCPPLTQ
jgi:hypothetical protein